MVKEESGLDKVSQDLVRALNELIKMAGGWIVRQVRRRPAYESFKQQRWKEQIAKLVRLDLAIRQAGTGGPWEWSVEQALAKARRAGLELNARTPQEPLLQVEAKRTVLEACAKQEARDQRKLQHERCAELLPKL